MLVSTDDRRTLDDAGRAYLHHLEHVLERKPSTVRDYRIMLERHMVPFFAARPLERIEPDNVAAYMAAKRRKGLATKTVINHLNFLHGVFAFAVKRRWVATNPVASVDRPRQPGTTPTSASSNWRTLRRCCGPCRTTHSVCLSACSTSPPR